VKYVTVDGPNICTCRWDETIVSGVIVGGITTGRVTVTVAEVQ